MATYGTSYRGSFLGDDVDHHGALGDENVAEDLDQVREREREWQPSHTTEPELPT